MREMDDKSLEQISGGASERLKNYLSQKLWNDFVNKNCGNCSIHGSADCLDAQEQYRELFRQWAATDGNCNKTVTCVRKK